MKIENLNIETPSGLKELYKEFDNIQTELNIKNTLKSKLQNEIEDLRKEFSSVGSYYTDDMVGRWFFQIFITLLFCFFLFLEYESGSVFYLVIPVIGLVIYKSRVIYNREVKKRETVKENKKKIRELETKIERLIDNLEIISSSVSLEENEFLKLLIGTTQSYFDSDGDNTIDIIQHDNEFMKILKSNQKMILEMEKSENRDFTKQFVKLSNFLVDKEKNLQSVFQRISDIDKLERFDIFKSSLIEQIQFYNVLRLNSLQMISSFVNDDRITFYVIYEKFDKLGVWNTNFESQFLFKMDLLNSNIESLISEIRDMSDSINKSIDELISITEETNYSLSNQLESIGSKLDTNNMLNTINTYQNYKTNKRLS